MAKQSTTTSPASKKQPLGRILRLLPWILVIGGLLGIIASYEITADKFKLLKDSHFQPACDLNPIISCGSVMQSKQANAFGFMNTYIGLIGFPILVTSGMAMLAGAKLKRWYWLGMQAGLTLGTFFAYWLLFESVYRIRALCPWCLTVDVVLTTMFWYVTLYNFHMGNLRLPAQLQKLGQFVKKHHLDLLLVWFLAVTTLILQHFWYYFGQQI
jgi:uncharacterized membrane protein